MIKFLYENDNNIEFDICFQSAKLNDVKKDTFRRESGYE